MTLKVAEAALTRWAEWHVRIAGPRVTRARGRHSPRCTRTPSIRFGAFGMPGFLAAVDGALQELKDDPDSAHLYDLAKTRYFDPGRETVTQRSEIWMSRWGRTRPGYFWALHRLHEFVAHRIRQAASQGSAEQTDA